MTSPTSGASSSAFRCSVAATRRGDSQIGTAAPARRWLLIEHPGPWGFAAVAESGIDPPVLEQIRQAAGTAGARILLVRRPGRGQPTRVRSWAVASFDSATVWGSWANDNELLGAVDVLRTDARRPPIAGAATEPIPAEPLLLVCAHGVHDTCCAVRGRPVAAALQAEWPDLTWECSHVGGDRFAPNVVVLPDGAYYGGLATHDAVSTIRAHLDGAVQARHLRGLSTMSSPAQAAAVVAHARYGPAGAREISAGKVQEIGDQHFMVELHGSGTVPARLRAVVRAHKKAAALLTCRAARESTALEYVVETLEVFDQLTDTGHRIR